MRAWKAVSCRYLTSSWKLILRGRGEAGGGDQARGFEVASVPEYGTDTAPKAAAPAFTTADVDAPAAMTAASAEAPVQTTKWYRLRQNGTAMARYLLDSEVHTYAFSVAANAILSFIPLVVLLYSLAWGVFHSDRMVGVVNDMVNFYLPTATHDPSFISRTIFDMVHKSTRHGLQVFSLLMILISCTGIFLPLEVALNQAWGVRKSRNYLLNQAIALGLAVWMVVLGLSAMVLSAGQRQVLDFLFFHHTDNWAFSSISNAWLAICTGAACILFFFSIYWILPHCKVPAKAVMRTSIVTGLIWLGARLLYALALPHLDLSALYGPFYVSVGLLFWAYISGLILFAGAQVSVARMGTKR